MSAPIKRYDCTNGKAQHCYGCYQMDEEELGDYVLHSDHIASHRFDEVKERELFEAQRNPRHCIRFKDGAYQYVDVEFKWQGWLACARSRAERLAVGAE